MVFHCRAKLGPELPKQKTLTATANEVIEMPDAHEDNPAPITAPRPMASPTAPPVGASLSFTFLAKIERRRLPSGVPAE